MQLSRSVSRAAVSCKVQTQLTALQSRIYFSSVLLRTAGRVGSAFAAELGTMQVSEQTDSLRVLGTDPVDYLVSPRVLACMIAGPVLNILCFAMGELKLLPVVTIASLAFAKNQVVLTEVAAAAIKSLASPVVSQQQH